MPSGRQFESALITGISGSGGSYLAEWLAEHQPQVRLHGISRWHSTTTDHLRALAGRVTVHECDLMDLSSVLAALDRARPQAIFHLAAHANVRASFVTPGAVLANNILGTSNLLEAIRTLGLDPMIQLCSSSEVYGQPGPLEIPIHEDVPLRPVSPYAVSKVAQDLMGFAYHRSYRMKIVRTRMFTYVNPRRTDLFATAFARQIARIEAGQATELVHGNLDSVRTLIDIRDAMEAYWLALEKGVPGEVYNIGGTTTLSVGEVLQLLVGLARCPIPTRQAAELLRPADITLQIPSTEKFAKATGWMPRYSARDSLNHLLDYWRMRTSGEESAF
jgi:GDP-4-dehydro-6-deoxy-D-mannose reductase